MAVIFKEPWRKSSYSGSNGWQCVEMAPISHSTSSHSVAIRDSKNPEKGYMVFSPNAVRAMFNAIRAGKYELPNSS